MKLFLKNQKKFINFTDMEYFCAWNNMIWKQIKSREKKGSKI